MGLIAPAFLIGLAALAVPISLHLVRREEPSGLPFPSLMFIRRMPYKTRRRHLLRDPLLLALRCLALAMVALAFAGPHLSTPDAGASAGSDSLDRVFLLDLSFSMDHTDIWPETRAALTDRIDAMTAGQRAAIAVFDQEVRLLQGFTSNRALLLSTIEDVRPGGGATDYAAALAGATGLLRDSVASRREVVMISDLQRTGLRGASPPALPSDIDLEILPVGPAAGPNAAVLSVDLMPADDGGPRRMLAVRLKNTGKATASSIRSTTLVDGNVSDVRDIELPPGIVRTLMVPVVLPDDRIVRVEVGLSRSGLAVDDRYFLVAAPERPLEVLLVVPRNGGPDKGIFLAQALALAGSPAFEVTVISAEDFDEEALMNTDVVILDDVTIPVGAVDRAMSDFIDRGGGLLVVAAEGPRGHWPGEDAGYLPGRIGPAVEAERGALGVGEAFGAALIPADLRRTFEAAFADVDVYRYRKLDVAGDDQVLAHYFDGAPALVERRTGSGRALVVTTTLDPRWSTFASASGFAPFVVEAVRYLSARPRQVPGLMVKSAFDPLHKGATLPAGHLLREYVETHGKLVVRTPAGDTVDLGPDTLVYRPGQPGFHEFHGLGTNPDPVPVAVNVDRTESLQVSMDTEEFLNGVERSTAVKNGMPSSEGETTHGLPPDEFWRYVLAAAILLLLLEAWLANRLAARGVSGLPS